MEQKHDWLKLSLPIDQVPATVISIMAECLALFRMAGAPSAAAMFARSENGRVTDLYFTPAMAGIAHAVLEPYEPVATAALARDEGVAVLIASGDPFAMLTGEGKSRR